MISLDWIVTRLPHVSGTSMSQGEDLGNTQVSGILEASCLSTDNLQVMC